MVERGSNGPVGKKNRGREEGQTQREREREKEKPFVPPKKNAKQKDPVPLKNA